MKETGILMIDDMRDAVIADLKTQTRRIMTPQPKFIRKTGIWRWEPSREVSTNLTHHPDLAARYCRQGRPGDRLYLKEDVMLEMVRIGGESRVVAHYRMPYQGDMAIRTFAWKLLDKATRRRLSQKKTWGRWTSKLLMYKFLARVWFEIADVRVEQVRDISNLDAKAEGVTASYLRESAASDTFQNGYRHAFAKLWNSINAKRGYGWSSNPWVFAITFRRLRDI